MNIYLKIPKGTPKPRTVKALLLLLFSDRKMFATKGAQTFSNSECTKLQCGSGRNRSIQDVYNLVTTYFPKATLKHVLRTLTKLRPDERYFRGLYCGQVRRSVMYYGDRKTGNLSVYGGSMSWANLFESIGIISYKDLYK